LKVKIINISKIVTWNPDLHTLNVIKDKQILIEDGIITGIGNYFDENCKIIDAKQSIITPGFIDSHTHPVFRGNRANEVQLRSEGKSYQDIKKIGGGILSSIKSVQKASFDQLYEATLKNIKPFINFGTTTLEAKSGYGLTVKDEIKSLKVIKKINNRLPIDVIPTFLGAHAVPDDYSTDKYVDIICNEMIPEVAENNLAIFCDVFCEEGYFNIEQTKKILETAKNFNLIPRIHADEFKYFGASKLAAELGAISADHLMVINNDAIKALAQSDTIATLLPGTTFFLNEKKYADGRKMIDNNVSVALASDFNPGTCTIRSLANVMFLSMRNCGMKLEEAFLGVTYNAARALAKENIIGLIKENYMADIIFWNLDSIEEIPYWFDSSSTKISNIMKKGILINNS